METQEKGGGKSLLKDFLQSSIDFDEKITLVYEKCDHDPVEDYLIDVRLLFNPDTELGKKLAGDAVLIDEEMLDITRGEDYLKNLTSLFIVADLLEQADESLIGDSGLTLEQLRNGGELLKGNYKNILKSGAFFTNQEEANEFGLALGSAVKQFKDLNVLHADSEAVKKQFN